MYKNQLQELAQRSCFNLPSYSCIREGPDHAPRFKATVNFNGEIFESPTFCCTLRQAEHAAAEVALSVLSQKGPSKALAARVLDETGVYKNLLQETAHRAGLKLPVYTTIRSGPGHVPVFSCTVELAGMKFTGDLAKTKKQAQKNAALAAWSALKKLSKLASSSSSPLLESSTNGEQEQVIIARYLATLRPREINNSQQRDRRLGRGSASVGRGVIPYGNTRSFSLQQQSWHCSQLSPELSLYQTHPQGIVSRQQDYLLALSALPPSSIGPQFFPIIRSILQPDQGHYFLSQAQEPKSPFPEIGPFLYFSNHMMCLPATSVSQVKIQEIEENPQTEEEWLVPRLSPTEIPSSVVSLDGHYEQRVLDMLQERDEKKSGSSASNTGNSIHQLQHNQTEPCNLISPGFMDARFRPRLISIDASKFHSQSAEGLDLSSSNIRPSNPSMFSSSGTARSFVPATFAAPVTIRSGAVSAGCSIRPQSSSPLMHAPSPTRISTSTHSPRPWPEGKKNLGCRPSVNFMAPAVHIRSVVPVCSSPPAKKFPGPSSEGSFLVVEKKVTEEPRAEISDASSDFSKLRI